MLLIVYIKLQLLLTKTFVEISIVGLFIRWQEFWLFGYYIILWMKCIIINLKIATGFTYQGSCRNQHSWALHHVARILTFWESNHLIEYISKFVFKESHRPYIPSTSLISTGFCWLFFTLDRNVFGTTLAKRKSYSLNKLIVLE